MNNGEMMQAYGRRLTPGDPMSRRIAMQALAIVVCGGGLLMALLVSVFLTRMPWP
jgi:hypothetical protein